MKTIHKNEQQEDNGLPFNGPGEWYPYRCRACNYTMWIEDIIVDAFPPNGPGKCPIIYCPICEQDFVRDIKKETIMSKTDPNFI